MTIDTLKFQAALNQIAEARMALMVKIEDLVDVMLSEHSNSDYSRHELLMMYVNSTAIAMMSEVNMRVEAEHIQALLMNACGVKTENERENHNKSGLDKRAGEVAEGI